MSNIKFKKDDAWELNEKNVVQIYNDCLATDSTPKDDVTSQAFSVNPNVPQQYFDYKKLKSYKEKLRYMLGQLYYTHHFQEDRRMKFNLPSGCAYYNKQPWTKNQTYLLAFYYLETATNLLNPFYDDNTTKFFDEDKVMPTLSPNDPKFDEWAKEHIED